MPKQEQQKEGKKTPKYPICIECDKPITGLKHPKYVRNGIVKQVFRCHLDWERLGKPFIGKKK